MTLDDLEWRFYVEVRFGISMSWVCVFWLLKRFENKQNLAYTVSGKNVAQGLWFLVI